MSLARETQTRYRHADEVAGHGFQSIGAPCSVCAPVLHSTNRQGRPALALGSDAARQGSNVKASFEAGIKGHLEILGRLIGESDGESIKAMAILSTMVGAVVLSRAVNDERLSKQFLQAAAKSVLMGSPASDAQQGPLP